MKEILVTEKGTGEKTKMVQRMFNRIAPSYDKLNRMISLGMDQMWRKKAIAMLAPYEPKNVLDVATGTGDLAIDLVYSLKGIESVLGVDISEEMMRQGKDKVHSLRLDDKISFEKQDCTQLTYGDNQFDAVIIAFGIRNFEDISKGLSEVFRVLKAGTPLIILELSEPTNRFLYWGYKFYAYKVIPFLGKTFSSDGEAYEYLPASISKAPQREAMLQLMREQGFTEAYYRSIFPGSCTIYVAIK